MDTSITDNLMQQIYLTDVVASKIQRWEKHTAKKKSIIDHKAFIEEVPDAKRKRSKKRPKLSSIDQLNIAHDILLKDYS